MCRGDQPVAPPFMEIGASTMKRLNLTLTTLLLAALLLGACTSLPAPAPSLDPGRGAAEPDAGADILTPRMLASAGALMGPSPSGFSWSPTGAVLTYVEPVDGHDVLWRYDAASGEKRVLLDPAASLGEIDVTSAQWSPAGDRLLLAGADGALAARCCHGRSQPGGQGRQRANRRDIHARRRAISFVQDNDLYRPPPQ